MIQLRDFIRLCLEDVVGAVADAQHCDALPKRAIINPRVAALGRRLDEATVHGGDWIAQMVEFDVAVTARREADGAPKIAVVGALDTTPDDRLASDLTPALSATSRIKFAVPVVLPDKDT